MYKKSVLLEAGLFDENLWPGEDVDIDLKIIRLGYTLYYNPDAIVAHYRPKDIKSFSRMMKRYGWAQSYLVKKYGPFRLIHFIPLILTAILVTLICILVQSPSIFLIMILSGAILLVTVFCFRTKSLVKGILSTILFLILILYWNMGFLIGLFSRGIKK
jgi:GT2 family glycosyltransferase